MLYCNLKLHAEAPDHGSGCARQQPWGNRVRNLRVGSAVDHAALGSPDRFDVDTAISHVVDLPVDSLIARERAVAETVHVLISGWTYGFKELPGGQRRRICSLGLAGDLVDLEAFVSGRLDYSVAALTPCRLGVVRTADLMTLCDARPHLVRHLWGMCALTGSVQSQWLRGHGGQSASQRLAHLLCETSARLQARGAGDELAFRLPLTQAKLGEALGISLVHANRVVRELRDQGLVHWRGASVVIANWRGLSELAEFDPSYLEPVPRAC